MIQWRGREIQDLGSAIGFGDPVLNLLVVDQEVAGGVIVVDVCGEEFAEGGDDGMGIFVEREVLEGWSVGGMDEAAGGEVGGKVIGAEGAHEGGVEFIDEGEDGVVVDGGTLVEESAGVEEDLGAGRSDGVGLVHYYIDQRRRENRAINSSLPLSRKARTGCLVLRVRRAAR